MLFFYENGRATQGTKLIFGEQGPPAFVLLVSRLYEGCRVGSVIMYTIIAGVL